MFIWANNYRVSVATRKFNKSSMEGSRITYYLIRWEMAEWNGVWEADPRKLGDLENFVTKIMCF